MLAPLALQEGAGAAREGPSEGEAQEANQSSRVRDEDQLAGKYDAQSFRSALRATSIPGGPHLPFHSDAYIPHFRVLFFLFLTQNDPVQLKRRMALNLPAPQVSDKEVADIAKLQAAAAASGLGAPSSSGKPGLPAGFTPMIGAGGQTPARPGT